MDQEETQVVIDFCDEAKNAVVDAINGDYDFSGPHRDTRITRETLDFYLRETLQNRTWTKDQIMEALTGLAKLGIVGNREEAIAVLADALIPITEETEKLVADLSNEKWIGEVVFDAGDTPLMYALRYGSVPAAEAVIELGLSNLAKTNAYGETALDLAVRGKYWDLAHKIAEKTGREDFNLKDADRRAAAAAQEIYIDYFLRKARNCYRKESAAAVITGLQCRGVDINADVRGSGYTLLMEVLQADTGETLGDCGPAVEALLEKISPENLARENMDGNNAADIARRKKRPDLLTKIEQTIAARRVSALSPEMARKVREAQATRG